MSKIIKLNRLKSLTASPAEQRLYALELLDQEKSIQLVQPALQVLVENAEPAARPALLRAYDYYDADGPKRDQACAIRAMILKALRPIAQSRDIILLEKAASTYQFMPPGRSEEGALLRASALVILNELDDVLAAYHCARLLGDRYTSPMSGEPALTAVRVLASQGNRLPLYAYVMQQGEGMPDVLSESLKNLTGIPGSLLPAVIDKFRTSEDPVVLAGLFDLILNHEKGSTQSDFVVAFLRTTYQFAVYRYVVTAIIASKQPDLIASLLKVAADERDRRKLEILIQALSLVRSDASIAAMVRELQVRLS